MHGYKLYAKLWICANGLDERNWVYDFAAFKEIKKQLEYIYDHTTVVAKDDPQLDKFKELHSLRVIDLRIVDAVGIEKTAENVFNIVNEYIGKNTDGRCWVSKVEVWEHDKNSAVYDGEYGITCNPHQHVADQKSVTALDIANKTEYINGIALPATPPVVQEAVVDPVVDTVADTVATKRPGEILPSKVGGDVFTNTPKPGKVVQGVPVGNTPTSGYNNLFKGTSWAKK